MKSSELTICGLAAVRARFGRDAGSIKRLFFDYETGRKVGMICKALAQAKRVYRCVEPAELEKIAATVHHGGIVAVVDAPELASPRPEQVREWAKRREAVLLLDRIGNAHNLGALARTAAFFGVSHLVIPAGPMAARPNDAAYRVAEGGFEHVTVWRVASLVALIGELRETGYDVAGAATRGGAPKHAPAKSPRALVLGNEEHGLSPEVAAACTRLITIPGSGRMESLNVSAAGAVLMWEQLARREGR